MSHGFGPFGRLQCNRLKCQAIHLTTQVECRLERGIGLLALRRQTHNPNRRPVIPQPLQILGGDLCQKHVQHPAAARVFQKLQLVNDDQSQLVQKINGRTQEEIGLLIHKNSNPEPALIQPPIVVRNLARRKHNGFRLTSGVQRKHFIPLEGKSLAQFAMAFLCKSPCGCNINSCLIH